MESDSSPPSKPDYLRPARFAGDRPSVPAALELDSATAWAEFERLRDLPSPADGPQHAGTTAPTPGTDFAPTQPDSGHAGPAGRLAAPPQSPTGPLSLHDAMVEARRYNRVCPRPVAWQQLHDMLLARAPAGDRPPPPPAASDQREPTSFLARRMVLRDQLQWAEAHGLLPDALGYLRGLTEEQWQHVEG
ncbi:hypothetical protein WG922_07195 [Ramlibacter sp. AN1015]|uniref:hypothetical protein n=1 Tax=Ramlibacter sp. AN1015 TaxID=3133428 RepID=UPI0030C1384A